MERLRMQASRSQNLENLLQQAGRENELLREELAQAKASLCGSKSNATPATTTPPAAVPSDNAKVLEATRPSKRHTKEPTRNMTSKPSNTAVQETSLVVPSNMHGAGRSSREGKKRVLPPSTASPPPRRTRTSTPAPPRKTVRFVRGEDLRTTINTNRRPLDAQQKGERRRILGLGPLGAPHPGMNLVNFTN